MKTALCFAGVVGGASGKGGKGNSSEVLKVGYDHYKRHIIDKNDIDVFVHTWTVDQEDAIRQLYKPIAIKTEKQRMFSKDKRRGYRKNNHFSRWYSTKQAVELKREYEKQKGFKYDCVMVARFDIAWNVDVVFSNFDMQHFYTSHWDKILDANGKHIPNKDMYKANPSACSHRPMGWPHDKNGLLDLFFFSSSYTMDNFSYLFDNMKNYLKPGCCPNDSSGSISNHQLSLYHLQQLGIENNIRFVYHYGVGNLEDYSLIRRKYFNSEI